MERVARGFSCGVCRNKQPHFAAAALYPRIDHKFKNISRPLLEGAPASRAEMTDSQQRFAQRWLDYR